MTFLCDEDVEVAIVERLRADGHEVEYVAEQSPGLSDKQVLERSNQLGAPLVTTDKDFGELVFRQERVHAGVVLLRLAGLSNDANPRATSVAIRDHGDELPKAFTVVSPGAVRIRRRM